MKKETRRSQRVSDLIRSELSLLLLTEAHDPDVKTVTITDVEMPPDLKSARVYFTARGGEAALARAGEGLARAAGYLRREVGRRCGLRYAPELSFISDLSLERVLLTVNHALADKRLRQHVQQRTRDLPRDDLRVLGYWDGCLGQRGSQSVALGERASLWTALMAA